MEDKQHLDSVQKETRSNSLGEGASSPHNTHSHHKERMDEGVSSSASENKSHHNHHSPHSETTVTYTVSSSINYNVNVQFDPAVPQAGKSSLLSLVVTEQKIGEPIKDFDIIHDKLM